MTAKVINLLDKLKQNRKELDSLYVDLEKSLTLKQLWPDAFDHGACKSRVVGNPMHGLTFTVTLGDGETSYVKPLEEVPFVLWSASVKKSIRECGLRAKAVYRDILLKNELRENQS